MNLMADNKCVIICIDDEKIVLDGLYRQLQRKFGDQYLYELAESGEEAKEIAQQLIKEGSQIIMVISDQIMPGISGDKLLEHFHSTIPKTIKILLTGQASLESAINVINHADLYRYITKPWDEQDFLLTVEKGIERYNLCERTERQLTMFQKFVPHQFLKYLYKNQIDAENIKLGDHIATEMTILFTDIRNFTTISESITPELSFNFINECISIIDPAIRDNNGFTDKYIGDAVMALFINPEEALAAAIAIEKSFQQFNKICLEKNVSHRPVDVGVGLHIGKVMLGVVGVEARLQVTVVSDAVNTASRVESLNVTYGTAIIISGELYDSIKDKSKFKFRSLGGVQLKGRSKSTLIYEVLDALPEDALNKKLATLSQFEMGIRNHDENKFSQAIENFNAVLSVDPDDKAAQVYLKDATAPHNH